MRRDKFCGEGCGKEAVVWIKLGNYLLAFCSEHVNNDRFKGQIKRIELEIE